MKSRKEAETQSDFRVSNGFGSLISEMKARYKHALFCLFDNQWPFFCDAELRMQNLNHFKRKQRSVEHHCQRRVNIDYCSTVDLFP
jgi:hypothetical protein